LSERDRNISGWSKLDSLKRNAAEKKSSAFKLKRKLNWRLIDRDSLN